jgi:hypothetical protein
MRTTKATRPLSAHSPTLGTPGEAAPAPDLLTAEGRRLARTAGAALALAALVTAFAATAQTAASGSGSESGVLPWIFALFVAAAVLGVFLVVLTLGRRPSGREEYERPGSRNH